MIKSKKCKVKGCEYERYANASMCLNHYLEHEKEKRLKKEEKRKARENKEQQIQLERNIKKTLHASTWKLMSEYIRRKDADEFGMNYCYTCGAKKHWKELQCGHFKHDKLDFDERNLRPQDYHCNNYLSGRLDVYAERLIKENDMDWFNQLVLDANNYKGYSIEEMLKIKEDLKIKIKELDNKVRNNPKIDLR